MTDQQTEQRQFTDAEALMYAPRAKDIGKTNVAVLDEAREYTRSLREHPEFGRHAQGGLEVISARRSGIFGEKQRSALKQRFGAELVTRTDRGIVTDEAKAGDLSEADKADAEASYEAAEAAIEQVGAFLSYAELLQEAAKLGKDPTVVAREKGLNFNEMQNKAVEALGQTDILRSLVGDIQNGGTRNLTIKYTLLEDPQLVAKVTERMRLIQGKVRKLPEVLGGKAARAEGKTELGQKQVAAMNRIVQNIRNAGLALSEEQQKKIQQNLADGVSVDRVLSSLQERYITGETIGESFEEIEEYESLSQQILTAQQTINSYTSKDRNGNITKIAAGMETVVEQANDFIQENRGRYGVLRSKQTTDPAFRKGYNRYKSLQGLFSDNRGSQGDYVGGIAQDLAMIRSLQMQEKDAGAQISGEQGQSGARESLTDRLAEESVIQAELEGILSESIRDVLEDRLERMRRQHSLQSQEAGKTAQEEGVRKVGEAMDKNWISFNDDEANWRGIVERDRIGQDIRTLAYRGEEGVKKLMLRDLMADPAFEQKSDEEQKKALEEAYKTHGDAYKDRLLLDFFTARGMNLADRLKYELRGSRSSLDLEDREWAKLYQQFGAQYEQRMGGSRELQELFKNMKEQGLAPNSKTKMILLLLLYFGVGFGATALLTAVGGPVGFGAAAVGLGKGVIGMRGGEKGTPAATGNAASEQGSETVTTDTEENGSPFANVLSSFAQELAK